MKYKKVFLYAVCICAFILICSIAGISMYKKYKTQMPDDEIQVQETEEEIFARQIEQLVQAEKEDVQQSEIKEAEEEVLEETEEKQEELLEEPITQLPVIPKDVYVMNGRTGKIHCYFEMCDEYIWEYYDEKAKKWNYVSENVNMQLTGEMDELNRSISTLILQGIEENDGLLVRCKVVANGAEEEYQAAFHVFSFAPEEIEKIEVLEPYEAEAGTYINTLDISVNIIKKDGSEEMITGLSDLFFCVQQDVASDMEKADDGTTVETITTTTVENQYSCVEIGEREMMLRYRGTAPGMDIDFCVRGKDSQCPNVEVQLSEYEIDNVEAEQETMITAEIDGEDNYSPLTNLLYAFKPKDAELLEQDFVRSRKIQVPIKENEVWTAYVKDEAGNIGSMDIEVITVDQKAPVIDEIGLKYEGSEWKDENVIIVSAEDKTSIQYCYICEEFNIDSGWMEESEYKIERNGIWMVKVRDAAGNESCKEITVANIDNQPPIILSIRIKEKNG